MRKMRSRYIASGHALSGLSTSVLRRRGSGKDRSGGTILAGADLGIEFHRDQRRTVSQALCRRRAAKRCATGSVPQSVQRLSNISGKPRRIGQMIIRKCEAFLPVQWATFAAMTAAICSSIAARADAMRSPCRRMVGIGSLRLRTRGSDHLAPLVGFFGD